jgi:hypothetical protein
MSTDNTGINIYLSKSLYIRGLQCHKSLYLLKHFPDLRDGVTESLEAIFQQGYEVGDYAKQLFPGGLEIPYEEHNYTGQVEKTREAISSGKEIIYEASFSYDDVFVKVDILRKGTRGWEIYEVKSSTEVKDVHLDDAAIQYYVLAGSGIPVSKTFIVTINNQYVRQGDIEPLKLFNISNITRIIEDKQKGIPTQIKMLREIIGGDIPDIDIGEYCSNPYDCDFTGHCWSHLPDNSVFDLCGSNKKKFALYRKGILRMEDAPLDELESRQQFQVEAFLKRLEKISSEDVRDFIDSLWYPIFFLDFETISQAVPPFDGIRPYQNIAFQYSLHYVERKGANPKHLEYLAEPGEDPREAIAKRLSKEIPTDACVLAYNKTFEIGILKNLKEWCPKHSKMMDKIIANIMDLKDPFSKRHIYHWKMNGSASLKKVLPALIPEMTYEGMEVSHGGEAQEAYYAMCAAKDVRERNKMRKALLDYCKQDTLAMVKLLEKINRMIKVG